MRQLPTRKSSFKKKGNNDNDNGNDNDSDNDDNDEQRALKARRRFDNDGADLASARIATAFEQTSRVAQRRAANATATTTTTSAANQSSTLTNFEHSRVESLGDVHRMLSSFQQFRPAASSD